MNELRELLTDDHPLGLLAHASATLTALAPRQEHPFAPAEERTVELPPVAELLESFVEASPVSAALAFAMATLSDDELLLARVNRGLAGPPVEWPSVEWPPAEWPPWVARLDQVEVVGAVQIVDALRDSDDLVVHVRIAGADLTVVVLVDFNLGTVVKDAFAIPAGSEEFVGFWNAQAAPGEATIEPLPLAEARARIEEAIEAGAQTWPPLESDSWPASRPLVEWVLRQLPSGGKGFVRPAWSERRLDRLTERFLSSPWAAELDPSDAASIVESLLWYGTDYGSGDPLRWSPAAVEILMLDWFPRKVMADGEYLRRMPAVLRAFVGFAHGEAKLSAALTAPTLEAIDTLAPEYLSQIGPGAARRPDRLSALGLDSLDLSALGLGLTESADHRELRLRLLADPVGSAEVLATLDDRPLPDEPFDASALPAEVQPAVHEVLDRCDACCEALFDVEHRTAVRRLLHDVALAKPRSFDGRGSPDTAAAALCWLVARANDEPLYPDIVSTADLLAHFGLANSPTSRITTFRQAVGADTCITPASLGSARYLTGAQRAWLIEARDS